MNYSTLLLAAGIATLSAPQAQGQSASPPAQEASPLKPILNIRLRHETADQDGFAADANALTAHIRAGFETKLRKDTSFLIDFEHVEALSDDYNSTLNGQTGYPVIADPEVTELNRLQLSNTSLPDTSITLGRQRIIQDGAWFVGNVGWRQDEQTFDAVRVVNTSLEDTTIDISYVDQINRIFADEAPAGRWQSSSVLATLTYARAIAGTDVSMSAFSYLLDFKTAPAASSSTTGIAVSAKRGAFLGAGRYARQRGYGSQPAFYEADYYQLEAGVAQKGLSFTGGIESLGSDNGREAFQRPLATLHKFNGFADVFLATPPDGLEDVYATASYAPPGDFGFADTVKLAASYHDFSAAHGSLHYGHEIDLVMSARLARTTVLAKYASYQADGFAGDRQKIWLSIEWEY